MCTAGTYGFIMWATSEMQHAVKRPSDSSEPGTCPRAWGENTPHTWLKLTPTFSKTLPRMRRDSPPPWRRWPSGLLHLRCSKRVSVSNCSNAAQMRVCRSRKYSLAGAAMSAAAGAALSAGAGLVGARAVVAGAARAAAVGAAGGGGVGVGLVVNDAVISLAVLW